MEIVIVNTDIADSQGVKPFLKYVGGKRWLARRIIKRLDAETLKAVRDGLYGG